MSHVLIADYLQDALRVPIGSKQIHLSLKEKERKQRADEVNIDDAVYMVTEVDMNVRTIIFSSLVYFVDTYTLIYIDFYL